MTCEELRVAINAVVEYNWRDELRDYEDRVEDGDTDAMRSHVFVRLVELDNFANDRAATPRDYLRPDLRATSGERIYADADA